MGVASFSNRKTLQDGGGLKNSLSVPTSYQLRSTAPLTEATLVMEKDISVSKNKPLFVIVIVAGSSI